MTPEQCKQHAVSYVSAHKAELGEDAWAKMPAVMGAVRGDPALRWASALDIKAAVEQTLEKTFGPRRAAGPKAKKAKEPKNTVRSCVRDQTNSLRWPFLLTNVAGYAGTRFCF